MQFLDFSKDLDFLNKADADVVVGIDEVGRGAWAGPVCVGGFILDTKRHTLVNGVNDSKKISKPNREKLSELLKKESYMVLEGNLQSINTIGIGKTITNLIFKLVEEIKNELSAANKRALFIIDGQFSADFGVNTIKHIKADSTFYSVAAASILAKVYRDNLMSNLHLSYNNYGFNKNMGYPTNYHLKALEVYGITDIHRTSFKPIKDKLINENY